MRLEGGYFKSVTQRLLSEMSKINYLMIIGRQWI